MANQASPSIKDNPFKRLDALRTKVSGVKAPAPVAAAPPVPPRRPSDGSTASHTSTASPPVPPRPAAAPKLPPRRPSDASSIASHSGARPALAQTGERRHPPRVGRRLGRVHRPLHGQAREGSGVGDPGGEGNKRSRPDNRPRKEEGLHVLESALADGRAEAEDLQAAEEALEYRHNS